MQRVSTHWKSMPGFTPTQFEKDKVNKDNLVNYMLVLKQQDVTYSFIMDMFADFNGKSLAHQYDTFDVPKGYFSFTNEKGKKVSNITPFTTTFGIWVFNIFFLQGFDFSYLFGGYYNEEIDAKKFKKINQKLVYALLEDKIDIDRYKRFLNYSEFFMPFEAVLSPNDSEKMLSCSKEIGKLKKKLLEENKEALEKPGNEVVAERIEKQLLNFALDYLKDDSAIDAYLSGAGGNIPNNFKNMYVMKGAIRDVDPNAKREFNIASSSFIDGIKADEYSLLANSLVGGPYSRSRKTRMGGFWEKLVEAATSTTILDDPGSDCGTDKYLEVTLTNDNIGMMMYSYIIKNNGELEELTSDNVDKYLNKKVKLRSALFCKSKTGVCHHCAGNLFYRRGGRNIGLACAMIPTKLKLVSMKAFHDSTVTTTEINTKKAFLGE